MHKYATALIVAVLLITFGCSKGSNPIILEDSNSGDSDIGSVMPIVEFHEGNRTLLGFWNIEFDLEALTAKAIPNRELLVHYNIAPWMPDPFPEPIWKIIEFYQLGGTYFLTVEVTLANTSALNGYDVRAIIFSSDGQPWLLNEDNWTGWWNQGIHGKECDNVLVNPFIAYFKDDLLERKFSSLAMKTELFEFQFMSAEDLHPPLFAIDASHPGNCEEPYLIENFTIDPGVLCEDGDVCVDASVDVYDWGNNIDDVYLVCEEITGEEKTKFTDNVGNTWSMDLYNSALASPGIYWCWIMASSSDDGDLFLYHRIKLEVIECNYEPDDLDFAVSWEADEVASYDVAFDTYQQAFTTGYFLGTIQFDQPLAEPPSSNGGQDIYVSKFNTLGEVEWARSWGGGSDYNNECGHGVSSDGSNVYITGNFAAEHPWMNVDFDPYDDGDPLTHDDEDLHKGGGAFLSIFDTNGDFVRAQTWGSINNCFGLGVIYDPYYNNVYVTGRFSLTVDFNPYDDGDPETHDDEDIHEGSGAFLSAFDQSGNFLWAKTWGEGIFDQGNRVDVDSIGSIYIVGEFSGEDIDFDPGPGIDLHDAVGFLSIFLSKFEHTGNFQWANTWGGTWSSKGTDLSTFSSGSDEWVFATGFVSTPSPYLVDFNPDPVETDWQEITGSRGMFLSKFDNALGVYEWAKIWGGMHSDSGEQCLGVDVDNVGKVYVTGIFDGDYSNPTDFDPAPLKVFKKTPFGDYDMFMSKFDYDEGEFHWAHCWGGWGDDYAYAVSVDNTNDILLTGTLGGWFIDFGDGNIVLGPGAFLTRLMHE